MSPGPDGTRILACNENEVLLAERIRAAGHNSAEVLIAFVPVEDDVVLGGGLEVLE
jgi:hypothetical protein